MPYSPASSSPHIGKAVRDGKTCYYIDDNVYRTFSGIVFDHCQYHLKAFKKGETEMCTVFGQTCDGAACPDAASKYCADLSNIEQTWIGSRFILAESVGVSLLLTLPTKAFPSDCL